MSGRPKLPGLSSPFFSPTTFARFCHRKKVPSFSANVTRLGQGNCPSSILFPQRNRERQRKIIEGPPRIAFRDKYQVAWLALLRKKESILISSQKRYLLFLPSAPLRESFPNSLMSPSRSDSEVYRGEHLVTSSVRSVGWLAHSLVWSNLSGVSQWPNMSITWDRNSIGIDS